MGDVDAFAILVHLHEPMLHAYVRAIIGDAERVDDVCQEAFVRAFQNLAALKEPAAFPAWLRTIARNLAFAELARRTRESATDPRVFQGIEDVFGALDAIEISDGSERICAVRDCVQKLGGLLKDCCERFYYRGQATLAIAEELSISLPAVLKRLERGRLAVADCLGKRFGREQP
ncbi:MAG: sigma-70 family RNA polymerase sigma factor [Planctomycetes bacterium]|nr:sigma-70 family RNA polymerase sigma factor [Planctomycetota bacterium]